MHDTKKNISNTRKINPGIIQKAYDYVVELLTKQLPDIYCFHNIEHTKEVLKHVEVIGEYHQLTHDDLNILKISAIFHDTGYIKTYKDHEEESVEIAESFLKSHRISETQIKKVKKAIMSTKLPQQPHDILSKILCDADLVNLTYENYFETAELMRKEWTNTDFAKMDEMEFHNNSLRFFKSHEFHTAYGKRILQPKKQLIFERIKDRQAQLKNQDILP